LFKLFFDDVKVKAGRSFINDLCQRPKWEWSERKL